MSLSFLVCFAFLAGFAISCLVIQQASSKSIYDINGSVIQSFDQDWETKRIGQLLIFIVMTSGLVALTT